MELTGKTLGIYRIIKELGRGGMAVVYLAEDTTTPHRRVALKILFPEAAQRLDILRRFHREADLYEKLKHPRIIHSYGLEKIDGYYVLVLDYMEGGSLAQRIKREGRIPWDEAVRITRQVAEALAFAHDQGIVHRDVKPSNILFDGFGDAYLADFGVAHDAEATTITQVGMQPGTYHYMAPEQIQGNRVDHRADQFSLATVFYQMICGYLPFSSTDPFALSYQIVNEPPALLPADLDAPHGIATVLNRAHAKDPNERYPNIMAFVNALERLSYEEPVSVAPIPKTKPHQPRLDLGAMLVRWGKWVVVSVLLLSLGFAAIRYLPSILASQPTPTPSTAVSSARETPPEANEGDVPLSQQAGDSGTMTYPSGGILILADTPTPTPTYSPTPERQRQKPTPTLIRFTPTPKRKRVVPTKPESPSSSARAYHTNGRVWLRSPRAQETLIGEVTFSWDADFHLYEHEAFELAFWRPGEDPMRFAKSPTNADKTTHRRVNMRGVTFVRQNSEWYWGVFLYDLSTNRRIKLLSEPRLFYYHGE